MPVDRVQGLRFRVGIPTREVTQIQYTTGS